VVDGGLSLQPHIQAMTPVDRQQRWVKAKVLLQSFAQADGVVLGSSDWTVAPSSAEVRAVLKKLAVPVLAANLTCGGEAPFPGATVVERDGRRIGLVGVTEGEVDGCVVAPPGPALAEAVSSLGPVDAVVALIPMRSEGVVAQVVGDTAVDVVVDGSGRYGASGPKAMGSGWAIGAGTRGKHLGRAELVFLPGASGGFRPVLDPAQAEAQVERLEKRLASVEERLERPDTDARRRQALEMQRTRVQAELEEARAALVPADGAAHHQLRLSELALSRDVADHPEALKWVEGVSEKIAQTALKQAATRVVRDASSVYAGSDACAGCHPAATKQWTTTGHAHAYATLAASGDAADASCVPCHVTGWAGASNDFRPYAFEGAGDGPRTPADVGGLRDVQCESCHGPSRAHAEKPTEATPLGKVPEGVCQQCHDNQRDDGQFDLETYRPKVVHGPG